ncbi:hypothetical protein V8C40DRAFT_239439 [Trichoderma camerunense]
MDSALNRAIRPDGPHQRVFKLLLLRTYLILLGTIHGAITHYRLPPPHSPAHVPCPKPQSSPGCVKRMRIAPLFRVF